MHNKVAWNGRIFRSTTQSTFQADDKSKMSMYKLRSTWDNYFPLKKLHSLDMTIKELDPNWPVKSLPSHLQDNATTNIHVNPKFIKKVCLGCLEFILRFALF